MPPLENYNWNPANYLCPPWKFLTGTLYFESSLTDIPNAYLCVLLNDRVWGGAEEEVEIENSSDGSVGDGWGGAQFNLWGGEAGEGGVLVWRKERKGERGRKREREWG